MDPEPLPKSIYTKALELGVKKIVLRFSGGNDEGYLDVELEGSGDYDFAESIKDWAWDAYGGYNGAGDGTDYGDDITYNLVDDTMTTREWYYKLQEEFPIKDKLEIAEEE